MKKRLLSAVLMLSILLSLIPVSAGAAHQKSPKEYLNNIAYYGDRNTCKMNATMALGYADVLTSLGNKYQALLVDFAGDGMPLLLTAKKTEGTYSYADWYEFDYWTWDGKKARKYNFDADAEFDVSNFIVHPFGYHDGIPAICVDDGVIQEYGGAGGHIYYQIKDAQLEIICRDMLYTAYIFGDVAEGGRLPLTNTIPSSFIQYKGEAGKVSQMIQNGWVKDDYGLFLWVLNGQYQFCNSFIELESKREQEYERFKYSSAIDSYFVQDYIGYDTEPCNWSKSASMQTALRSYANALNEIKVVLNGKEIKFDQPPIMVNNRILVPIRKIAEAMGDDVYWNSDYRAAFIKHGKEALIIEIDESEITIVENEKWKQWTKKRIDVPAMIFNGRTLVPVRAFCESLGSEVEWDGDTRTAYITYDFTKKTGEMDVETFANINTVYYALNGTADRFKVPTEDIEETYDRRKHTVDAVAMGVSDVWSGVKELLSGLSNSENLMKDNIGEMFTKIPGNEVIVVDPELLKTIKEYEMSGFKIFKEAEGIDDAFLKKRPLMKSLDSSIEELGITFDITIFSIEQLAVLFSNYEMNIQYIQTLRDTLDEQGLLNEALRTSLIALEQEYANKFWQTMVNTRDELVEFTISEGMDLLTAGIFQLGDFTWKQVFKITGVTESGQALKTFYSLYCINGALDMTYQKKYNKVVNGQYTAKDVVELKRLDDMQRATKISLYHAMESLYNKKEMKTYCKEMAEKLSDTCVIWKAE